MTFLERKLKCQVGPTDHGGSGFFTFLLVQKWSTIALLGMRDTYDVMSRESDAGTGTGKCLQLQRQTTKALHR